MVASRSVRINITGKEDEASRRYRIEKLHIETGIYIRYLKYALHVLHQLCDETFGFSKAVKGLFYFNKTMIDIRSLLDLIVGDETRVNFPSHLVYDLGISNNSLELFIQKDRPYKVNFRVPILEKLKPSLLSFNIREFRKKKDITELSIDQYRMIERINILTIDTMKQLSLLINNRGYNRTNQRRLFLAIDRIGKWYSHSKKIFDKSSKHCDKMRKNVRMVLMASKFDRGSGFYGVPREIVRTIFDFVW